MSAVQQTDRYEFGTGRLFVNAPGGQRISYGKMQNIQIDLKVDLKELYGEAGFPVAVADGHRTIDISGDHLQLSLDTIALDLGIAAPTAGVVAVAYDEAITVATHAYTLVNSTAYVPSTAVITMGPYAKRYTIVAPGSEAVGVSCSITAGVITFATGETYTSGYVTYAFTDTSGSMITINSTYQNSATPYAMVCTKRDIAPDGSVGTTIATFNAVRAGGISLPWKEGDYSIFKRTFKAYADPNGIVGTLQFVNQTTSDAP